MSYYNVMATKVAELTSRNISEARPKQGLTQIQGGIMANSLAILKRLPFHIDVYVIIKSNN